VKIIVAVLVFPIPFLLGLFFLCGIFLPKLGVDWIALFHSLMLQVLGVGGTNEFFSGLKYFYAIDLQGLNLKKSLSTGVQYGSAFVAAAILIMTMNWSRTQNHYYSVVGKMLGFCALIVFLMTLHILGHTIQSGLMAENGPGFGSVLGLCLTQGLAGFLLASVTYFVSRLLVASGNAYR
jgi:hypothetical protein